MKWFVKQIIRRLWIWFARPDSISPNATLYKDREGVVRQAKITKKFIRLPNGGAKAVPKHGGRL